MLHHKKSGLWLAPGGHIEADETLEVTLKKEAFEELGLEISDELITEPFFATITDIENPSRSCRRHFNIWFSIDADRLSCIALEANLTESYGGKWFSLEDREIYGLTEMNNISALLKIKESLLLNEKRS